MEDVKLYLVNQFSHFTYYNFVLLPFLLLLLLTVIALGFKEKEVVQRSSVKKVFLEISQNLQENACVRVSFLIKLQTFCNFSRKETVTHLLSCEFCEISTEQLQMTASVNTSWIYIQSLFIEYLCQRQLGYQLHI